ncbi:hypothetical protein L596_003469 [Steinernema carpocapsae]|uniref:Transmembrane protein n=1 Tax=Steinernema carpocapsae TaxID=34508 RepID=A0A4U8USH5_STECR|nr:hypothetical protein L596_003469 [Steinernema carpocapsae]
MENSSDQVKSSLSRFRAPLPLPKSYVKQVHSSSALPPIGSPSAYSTPVVPINGGRFAGNHSSKKRMAIKCFLLLLFLSVPIVIFMIMMCVSNSFQTKPDDVTDKTQKK